MNSVCILGLGYIGLPTAAMFATHGIKVIGVDVNPHVVETLNRGEIHIHEPGLLDLVKQAIASGNFQASHQPEPADAFIIAVPTPFYGDKQADMRFVISAAEAITPFLRTGNLVILESTSPPLTTTNIVKPILDKSGLTAGESYYLAYSPERVLPGQILNELVENARVIGGINPISSQRGRDLYATFVRGEIVMTSATTAEMVKLMENTYRDVNIAIANEFALLAERFQINVWEAIEIANRHPRVKILKPGPGVGGHCISVDPWFFVEAAPDLAKVILASRQRNDHQPHHVVELIARAGAGLKDRRIAALGLAYKPDVDDLRESPAVEVCNLLSNAGAVVKAFEPYKLDQQFEKFQTVRSLAEAIQDADTIVLLVNHKNFRDFTPQLAVQLTRARTIVDTVNMLNASDWKAAGFRISLLGNTPES